MRTLLNLIRTLGCSTLCLWVVSFLASPASAAVESDVVGYTTIEMKAGKWYQIGNPFVELEDGSVPTLNTVFTDGFGAGDTLYLLPIGSSTYLPARMWADDYNDQTGWFNSGDLSYDNTALSSGQAIFIKKVVDGTVTLKGKVSAKEIVSFNGEGAWTQIVCVYPKQCSLNDLHWEGVQAGDQLYIYDANRGTYLPARMWADNYNGKTGWFNSGDLSYDTEQLPIGQAFFINKRSASSGTVRASVD